MEDIVRADAEKIAHELAQAPVRHRLPEFNQFPADTFNPLWVSHVVSLVPNAMWVAFLASCPRRAMVFLVWRVRVPVLGQASYPDILP